MREHGSYSEFGNDHCGSWSLLCEGAIQMPAHLCAHLLACCTIVLMNLNCLAEHATFTL